MKNNIGGGVMSNYKAISLEDVDKSDVAICPKCGVIFVKSLKGQSGGFLWVRGFYCPACNSLVCRAGN